ncbi:MAG: hypothetical protein J6W94_07145 [Bacteroidales bacterium]|nr:hypothetical protein [Bacteroidales bacterium]
MRKLVLTIMFILAYLTALAQGRVSTKKYLIRDFQDKITKVVLPGSDLLDGALRQEVVNCWTLSPFEFCTTADFEKLKKSPDYYFLLAGATVFKGESAPSLVFLTLVKGGPEAGEGTSGMHEVISIPLCPAGSSTGRELVFLGAIVNSIQDFTEAAMESEKNAYLGTLWFNGAYRREGKMMSIWMSGDDVDGSVADTARYLDPDFFIIPEDESDGKFLSSAFNTLCSYVVAPLVPVPGASWCYNMLFEANTHRLVYISRHRITEDKGPGFTERDFKKIARAR